MLTTFEQAFCHHYLATGGDGAEAVRLAGYRTHAPGYKAMQLLAREDIRLALEASLRDTLWGAGLTPRYLAQQAMAVLEAATQNPDNEPERKISDPKSALELLKLLGKWAGLEDCGDRKLNHEGIRLSRDGASAAPAGVTLPALPRPDPEEWEKVRETKITEEN